MLSHLELLFKIIFFLIAPAVIIYCRVKKKIKTAFAVGLLLTSFVLGVIFSSSFQEDPIDNFEKLINSKKRVEAKKALKVIIQYGHEKVSMINDSNIIEKDLYMQIKSELIKEYDDIARKYNDENLIEDTEKCGDIEEIKKILGNLKGAVRIIKYSESIGGKNEKLKSRLNTKIKTGKQISEKLKVPCE